VRSAAFEALAREVVGAAGREDMVDRAAWPTSVERVQLTALARGVFADVGASDALRGSAARLMLAVEPEAGLAAVRAALQASRPTAEDPHGASAAALVAALDVAGAGAVALVAELALDERRP
jgi:hypothetical protein